MGFLDKVKATAKDSLNSVTESTKQAAQGG